MADPTVLDISHYQSEPNWRELLAVGVIGVILKATEGTSYKDPTFDDRFAAADEAGLCVSTYHFLKHGSIQQQMQWYQEVVDFAPGERVIIDYEDAACTLSDLEAAVKALWEIDATLQITTYGSNKLTSDARMAKKDTILKETSLWIARYSSSQPDIATNVWPVWSLWQYTDRGTVAGWGPVDCNRFNGSDEALVAWFGPAQPPAPAPEVYTVTIPSGVTEVHLIIER